MSLKWYVRPRIVTLKSKDAVLDAARAIEHNNIGAVVVQDRGKVVGIVTDRDLTIRALGRGLDPHKTTIGEVVTSGVVSLAPSDTQVDAIRLMQKRNIRRIPLVEDGRFVGMVTLDDLLLGDAAPLALRRPTGGSSINCARTPASRMMDRQRPRSASSSTPWCDV
jgi:CBS domain-containing protein